MEAEDPMLLFRQKTFCYKAEIRDIFLFFAPPAGCVSAGDTALRRHAAGRFVLAGAFEKPAIACQEDFAIHTVTGRFLSRFRYADAFSFAVRTKRSRQRHNF